MPLILSGNVASATAAGYEVANSCRFDDAGTAYMHKTPGSSSATKLWTFSCWIKLGNIKNSYHAIFSAFTGTSDQYNVVGLDGSNRVIFVSMDEGSGGVMNVISSAKLRDPSAWYHICTAYDSAQSTASNRVKGYINGVQCSSFSTETYPDQNKDGYINSDNQHNVGKRWNANYFDGYMAEVVFIDGTAYAASDFGEFDEDSPTIWKPKDVSGLTFGTNGFYLDFEASDNLGNDANGGTDLTEVNLAATDQATDTPTNNFATMNPLNQPHSDKTFLEGNTKVLVGSASGSHHVPAFSTIAVTAGKWYVEGKCTETDATKWTHGIANVEFLYNKTGTTNWIPGRHGHSQDDTIGMYTDDVWKNGSETVSDLFGSSESDGDIVMMAIDCDNGKIWFGRNGTWNNGSATDSTTFNASSHDETFTAGDDYFVHFTAEDTAWLVNFGNPAYANSSSAADENGYGDFEYAPPSGFLAICTKNLESDGG